MVDVPAARPFLRQRIRDDYPRETLIVALAAFPRQIGELNLWILGATALLGAMPGDNVAHTFGLASGVERRSRMPNLNVQKVFGWARYELRKSGAVTILRCRYIAWAVWLETMLRAPRRFRAAGSFLPRHHRVRVFGGHVP